MTTQELAATTTYEDTVDLVRKIVWEYIQKYNRRPSEFDELFSRANLYFMIAYESHIDQRSEFTTWLYIQVWNRLLNEDCTEQRHHYNKQRPPRPMKPIIPGWKVVDMIDELSGDGKALLNLYYSGVMDLQEIYKGYHKNCSWKPIFKFLKQQGWTRQQIFNSFNDIKKIFE